MDYNQQRRPYVGYGYRQQAGCGCQGPAPAPVKTGCGPVRSGCQNTAPAASVNTGCGTMRSGCQNTAPATSVDTGCGTMRTDCVHPMEMDGFAIAMAYVPWQECEDTYCPGRALMAGTIFPTLDQPFCAAGRCAR